MAGDPIREALFDLLDGDDELKGLATGGVWHLRADADAEFPLAVFQKQSGVAEWSMGGSFKNQLWLVKGICRGGDQEEAEAIDARCEVLLNDAALEIAGHDLMYLRRGTDVIYPEDDAGETIFHVGALYRLIAEPS